MGGLFKLYVPMSRSADLEGIFVAPKEWVDCLIRNEIEIYFGEIAGKHSEVYGVIERSNITLITDEKSVLDIVISYNLETGINPFDYGFIGYEERYFKGDTVADLVEYLLLKGK